MKGSVTKVMIDLRQVGIVGLREAFKETLATGGLGEDDMLTAIMARITRQNYIPDAVIPQYRRAVWREFLRDQGRVFSDYYAVIPLVIHGDPGGEREQFVATLVSVLAEHELQPEITFGPPQSGRVQPELWINDQPVISGLLPRQAFRAAIKKRISHW